MQGIKKQNLQVDAGEAVGLQNNFHEQQADKQTGSEAEQSSGSIRAAGERSQD